MYFPDLMICLHCSRLRPDVHVSTFHEVRDSEIVFNCSRLSSLHFSTLRDFHDYVPLFDFATFRDFRVVVQTTTFRLFDFSRFSSLCPSIYLSTFQDFRDYVPLFDFSTFRYFRVCVQTSTFRLFDFSRCSSLFPSIDFSTFRDFRDFRLFERTCHFSTFRLFEIFEHLCTFRLFDFSSKNTRFKLRVRSQIMTTACRGLHRHGGAKAARSHRPWELHL